MALKMDHTGAGDITLDSTAAGELRVDGNPVLIPDLAGLATGNFLYYDGADWVPNDPLTYGVVSLQPQYIWDSTGFTNGLNLKWLKADSQTINIDFCNTTSGNVTNRFQYTSGEILDIQGTTQMSGTTTFTVKPIFPQGGTGTASINFPGGTANPSASVNGDMWGRIGTARGLWYNIQGTAYEIPLLGNTEGKTWSAKQTWVTPTTSTASITLPHGTAPSAPADGDVWTTTGGMYVRVNGSTVGPLAAGGSFALNDLTDVDTTGVAAGDIIYYNGSSWADSNGDFLFQPGLGGTQQTIFRFDFSDTNGSGLWSIRKDDVDTLNIQFEDAVGTIKWTQRFDTSENLVWISQAAGDVLTMAQSTGYSTFNNKLITSSSTTSRAGFSILGGSAPTAPADGDIWATGGGTRQLYMRMDGVTYSFARLEVANTWTGKQTFPATTTGAASVTLPHGTAPTTPTNGDLWTTTTGVFARVNGSTVDLTASGATTLGALTDVDLTGAADNDLLVRSGGNWIDTGGALTWGSGNFSVAGEIINTTNAPAFTGRADATAGSRRLLEFENWDGVSAYASNWRMIFGTGTGNAAQAQIETHNGSTWASLIVFDADGTGGQRLKFNDGFLVQNDPALFIGGSAAAPGIAFSGDPGTGFYRSAAQNIDITVNGSQMVNISDSTSTGLLTWTGSVLTVNRQANAASAIHIGETTTARGSAQDSYIRWYAEASSVLQNMQADYNGSTMTWTNSAGNQMIFEMPVYLGSGNLADGDIICRFNTDRSWDLKQHGADASAALKLQPGTDSKAFRIHNQADVLNFYFLPYNSGTADPQFRIYDAGGTDYVEFTHDGTDLNMAVTNTTDVNFTGATYYKYDNNIYVGQTSSTRGISMDTLGTDGAGQKRITWNDGAGNWNFNANTRYSAGQIFTTAGAAGQLRFDSDAAPCVAYFRVSNNTTDATQDAAVTWGPGITITGGATGQIDFAGSAYFANTIYPQGQTIGQITAVTGNFGSIQVTGADGSSGTWSGYSIGGEVVFMSNLTGSGTTNRAGIYDDINNTWVWLYNESQANNEIEFYYNGTGVMRTANTGIDICDTAGDDPLLGFYAGAGTWTARQAFIQSQDTASGGELLIRNEVHAGFLQLQGENTSGTITNLFLGDPDAEVRLYYAGVEVLSTVDEDGNNNGTGAEIRHADQSFYPVGMNVSAAKANPGSFSAAATWLDYMGHTVIKTNTTAFTATTPASTDTTIPNGGIWNFLNFGGTGDITIAAGSGVTLTWMDGTGGSTGSRTIADGGVATLWKRNVTNWYIWGNGIS